MCPMCWASLLAYFSVLLAPSMAIVAMKDWLTLLLAWALATIAAAHQLAWMYSPWWAFVGLFGATIARIGWLGMRKRERFLLALAPRISAKPATTCCRGASPKQAEMKLQGQPPLSKQLDTSTPTLVEINIVPVQL